MSEEAEVQERDYESEARAQGWRPEGELDAKEFVERGEKILPIVKSKLTRVEERLEAAERANKRFGEYHKKTLERERKEHAKKISALEAKLEKAVTDGDGETFTRTNRELDNLRKETPEEPGNLEADEYNRLAQSWASSNDWYGSNKKLTGYADGIAKEVNDEGYYGKAYFTELTRRVKEEFPEEFKNPNRSKANGVEAGGEKGGGSNKKSYANLPADAKAACDDFVKQGFMTKEEYVAQYDWE